MSTSGVSGSNNSSSVYSNLGLTSNTATSSSSGSSASAATSAASSAINEQDFLQLMTTQLQDQDPLNPVSNAEFFSQIAQFSTVSGINQLNTTVSSLSTQLNSSQTLQAASLIGQTVLVQGSKGQLTSSGMYAAVQVPASGDVTVQVRDSSGNLVNTLDLGTQSAGTVPFSWDGKDSSGNAMAAGTYTISATVGSGSSAQTATTDVAAEVLSVTPSASGTPTLTLSNVGQVSLSQIQQII